MGFIAMYLTGFADEYLKYRGSNKGHKELGWNSIEAQSIGGSNIRYEPEFERVCNLLSEHEIS